jgi:tetratricopeptide (TPR) repeat protein
LTPEEQNVLPQLSLFRGGFTAKAAASVAGATLPLLSRLVDKSLLRVMPAGRDGLTLRYEMHEFVRRYGEERLRYGEERLRYGEEKVKEAQQVEATVRSLHSAYYAAWLKEQEEDLRGSEEQREAVELIKEEIENIRLAWQWALEQRKIGTLSQALHTLFLFHDLLSRFQEGEELFRMAVERLSDEKHFSDPDDATRLLMGQLVARQGAFCSRLSQYEKSEALLRQSLALAHEADPLAQRAFALNCLSEIYWKVGNYEQARQLAQESLSTYQAVADDKGTADVLKTLGIIAYFRGDYAEAKRFYEESLAIRRRFKDQLNIAHLMNNLALVAGMRGELHEAKKQHLESLTINRAWGDRMRTAASLTNLGFTSLLLDENNQAEQFVREALAIYQDIGDYEGVLTALIILGYTAGKEERFQESEKCFRQALKLAVEVRVVPKILECLVGIARHIARKGDHERALTITTFVQRHPVTNQIIQYHMESLLYELKSALPGDIAAVAEEKAKKLVLAEIVAELLAESHSA